MVNTALKSLVIAACLLLLSGCTTWRQSLLSWRLGLEPAAAQRAVDPQVQQAMDQHYARGAAALARNDLDAAIAAWRQYALVAPVHRAQTRKLRGYLTLLEREAAKRFAKAAAAREKATVGPPTNRLHVALFPFQAGVGQGARAAPSFNRAVMAMITTDLSRVPALTVLEREKIDLLLQEMKLAQSGLVDAATLRAPGALLGAGTAIALSVHNQSGPAGPGSGRYKINTAVSDVQQGVVLGVQEADGGQSEFFVLEKRIVHGILQTLGIQDYPAAVNAIHTRSWEAYARFADGLKLLDEDRFDEARKAFLAALAFDPAFALAQEAFLNTPERAATLEEIKAALPAGL